jgi:NADPH-dependent ferric siderophore reductase
MSMAHSVERLIETVPSRPAGDLDDAAMLAKAPESSLWELTVTARRWLVPRMLRLTVSAPGLESMAYRPGQDFTVLVALADGRAIRRRYTLAGRSGCSVYLDVFVHGDGVGAAWATSCRPGDRVSAIGPRGKFVFDSGADWYLFLGDETSIPGIRAMMMATDAPARVAVEVDHPADWQQLSLTNRSATQWIWLPRDAKADVIRSLNMPGLGRGAAYISGEASRVHAWRTALERYGFDSSLVSHKAYWGLGRANATHGEPLD